MTETLMKSIKKPDLSNNIEIMLPKYGVKISDVSPKPQIKEELYTGTYEANPEILGRKISKLSYVASFPHGMTPGYLEKVESTRKLQSKLMIDTSSVAIDFDAVHLDSTINQQS